MQTGVQVKRKMNSSHKLAWAYMSIYCITVKTFTFTFTFIIHKGYSHLVENPFASVLHILFYLCELKPAQPYTDQRSNLSSTFKAAGL